VTSLKESIVLASRTAVPVRKFFTPILKAKNISAKQKDVLAAKIRSCAQF
jgi:hypothetical protein